MSSIAAPPKPWEGKSAEVPLPEAITQSPAMSSNTPNAAADSGSGTPAVPQRPPQMMEDSNALTQQGQNGLYGNSSPYNRYGTSSYGTGSYGSSYGGSSLYGMNSMNSMYGGGMYGGGMYGGGMYGGGMGGMGGMYGMNGMNGMNQGSFAQSMENSTAATFQLIQGIVGAFGGFAQMLESTFMATHSSFFAMIGVAEQIARLRDYLGQVLSVFALWRWCKSLILRLLGRKPSLADEFVANASAKDPPAKFSKKPLIVFFLTVVGLPYLMSKLVRIIIAKQEEESRRLMSTTTIDPNNLTFVRATFDYPQTQSEELTLHKNDIIAVLTPPQERTHPGWWRGRLRDGTVGWFPSTHVSEIKKQV